MPLYDNQNWTNAGLLTTGPNFGELVDDIVKCIFCQKGVVFWLQLHGNTTKYECMATPQNINVWQHHKI